MNPTRAVIDPSPNQVNNVWQLHLHAQDHTPNLSLFDVWQDPNCLLALRERSPIALFCQVPARPADAPIRRRPIDGTTEELR